MLVVSIDANRQVKVGVTPMTRPEFIYECETRTIDPEIALENEHVRDALLQRDDEHVRNILDAQF